MNHCLILTHNNLDLTQQCVESLRKQDIPTTVYIVDNWSVDGTLEYAEAEGILLAASKENTGFSKGINVGLDLIFKHTDADYCLVTGSDTILPPYYYRTLLALNLPVVSGVQDINGHRVRMEDLAMVPPVEPIRPNPDFSSILFRKDAWVALGGFDERMKNYCSDCDLHIRAHRLGIEMSHCQVPFFHYGSSTIKNASPKEKRILNLQADADRVAFFEKWGHRENGPQYDAHFVPAAFGIDKK